MTTYIDPYTGVTINPSQVGYESLTISVDTVLQWPINGNNANVVANQIDVLATVGSLNLFFPPATQVSTGASVIIRNTGSNTFTVVDTSGNTIVSIASGVVQYIYLTNNSTQNGTWSTLTFGAGTSSANASALAGYGLTAINTTLNQSYNLTNIYSNYTLTNVDRAQFLVWQSGAGNMTLPSASSVGNNWFTIIRNNGTGILTVYPVGSDTIDNNAQAQLQLSESFVIVSNGSSGYNTYGYGQSATFVFTQLNKVVTGGTVTLSVVEASSLIQEYSGTLTSNCTVILPPTVQLYSLQNKTTGSFTLTFKTTSIGATTVVLPQGQTVIAICDGTNVYNAQTATSNVISALTIGNGSAAAPSLSFSGDATTGLYLAASGQLGFSTSGSNRMTLSSTGLAVPNGISGGSFP
jgi:hypothetical protein